LRFVPYNPAVHENYIWVTVSSILCSFEFVSSRNSIKRVQIAVVGLMLV
jgi:hypothetical protein